MADRSTGQSTRRARARAVAVVRDERPARVAAAVVSALGILALLLLLTNP